MGVCTMSKPTYHCKHETITSSISGRELHISEFTHDFATREYTDDRFIHIQSYFKLEAQLETLKIELKLLEETK